MVETEPGTTRFSDSLRFITELILKTFANYSCLCRFCSSIGAVWTSPFPPPRSSGVNFYRSLLGKVTVHFFAAIRNDSNAYPNIQLCDSCHTNGASWGVHFTSNKMRRVWERERKMPASDFDYYYSWYSPRTEWNHFFLVHLIWKSH